MSDQQMLIYLSGFPKELAIALLFFVFPLKRKERFVLRLLAPAALLACEITFFFFAWAPLYTLIPSEVIFGAHYLMVCLIFAWGVQMCFDVQRKEGLYCVVCAYIAEHVVYCVGNLVNHAVGFTATDLTWVYWLIHLGGYALFYWAFIRTLCRDGHYATSTLESVWLLAFVWVLVYVMSLVAISMELEWMHAIYALICCAAMLQNEYIHAKHVRLQEEIQAKEYLWKLNKAQYELNTSHVEAINRKCHDLKHQLIALRTMEGEQEKDAALTNMEQAVMIYDTIYHTGNRTLDTVLSQKALVCTEKQIPLHVIADGSLLNFMEGVDLYTLIANILDNAIEANERLPEEQPRSVNLTLHEKKGLILLQAENPYFGSVDIDAKDGLPVTSKADKDNHGIGTRSILYTVEKYHGYMQIKAENRMFVLRITFPAESPSVTNQDENLHS